MGTSEIGTLNHDMTRVSNLSASCPVVNSGFISHDYFFWDIYLYILLLNNVLLVMAKSCSGMYLMIYTSVGVNITYVFIALLTRPPKRTLQCTYDTTSKRTLQCTYDTTPKHTLQCTDVVPPNIFEYACITMTSKFDIFLRSTSKGHS